MLPSGPCASSAVYASKRRASPQSHTRAILRKIVDAVRSAVPFKPRQICCASFTNKACGVASLLELAAGPTDLPTVLDRAQRVRSSRGKADQTA